MKKKIISIAPMMNCTDRHDRYFLRLISPNVLLYTEMVTTGALLHGDTQRFLAYHPNEHPLALQVGGSDPQQLAICAELAAEKNYDEINLNVGCPSDRVQSGKFGACLMLEPNLVAQCIHAMCQKVKIPVTVKCRIGVDDKDSYETLYAFIDTVSIAGCNTFIVHARKALLKGLSPKENRSIPPLQYEKVYALKKDFPHLTIILNGGVKTVDAIQNHLNHVDGVMIGREAYSNPYFLAEIENNFFGTENIFDRKQVIEAFIPYVKKQLENKVKLSTITKHIVGLFQGQVGARKWRQLISDLAHRDHMTLEYIFKLYGEHNGI